MSATPPTAYDGWRRLDLRSIVTAPLSVIRQAGLPALAGLIGLASTGVGALVILPLALVAAALVGLVPWLTTTFRVTATHLEVRRGVLNRGTVTVRLDRVRGVQLEANVLHRALGITKVAVGTGVDEGQIELDALGVADAQRLRGELLRAAPAAPGSDPEGRTEPSAGTELARLDWSWLRFAPLNLRNLLIAAAAVGALLSQVGELLPALPQVPVDLRIRDGEISGETWDQVTGLGLVALGAALAAFLLLWVPGACLGFAVRWGGLRVTRETGRDGSTLRRTFGLLTQREAEVEEAKVRGAVLTTPLLVGAAGGAEAALLTTGLDDNEPDILPTAPRATVRALCADVLGERDAMEAPLAGHGSVTRRRYHMRSLRSALLLTLAVTAAAVAVDRAWGVALWWPPVAAPVVAAAAGVLVAELRWRHLGHRVTQRYVVVRAGVFTTRRTALESDAVVGWRIEQSFWDRRRGLAQLVATTAAGGEHVTIPDLPLEEAVAVAAAATPRVMADFLTPTG